MSSAMRLVHQDLHRVTAKGVDVLGVGEHQLPFMLDARPERIATALVGLGRVVDDKRIRGTPFRRHQHTGQNLGRRIGTGDVLQLDLHLGARRQQHAFAVKHSTFNARHRGLRSGLSTLFRGAACQ